LVKFGTRYYNPNLGRWTQQDPVPGSLGNPDSLNPYLYAGEDPVNEVDPTGAITGNCGSSFIDVTGGTLPGFADIYFALDSTLGSIVFFSVTITLIGGSLDPFITLVDVKAPFGAFYDEIIPAVATGPGFIVAILSGFAVLANGTTCSIFDVGFATV
jgi:hypothetical protein